MELSKGVILVSGGLDSTTLMYLFVKQNIDENNNETNE